MAFSVTFPQANVAPANAALEALGRGANCVSVPVWTNGVAPGVGLLHHLGDDAVFQAQCAALPGATVRTYGQLVVGTDATVAAVSGRWGGSAPLLTGNVTPGLYRATDADGGGLWWVIQPFNRATFNLPLHTPPNPYPALLRPARVPGEVTPWVQPIDGSDAYQAVNPFTGLPDRVLDGGLFWDCLTANNVTAPSVGLWRQWVENGDAPWRQPLGAGDGYPLNARVTHLGQTWQNNVAGNTFAPGVSGWTVI